MIHKHNAQTIQEENSTRPVRRHKRTRGLRNPPVPDATERIAQALTSKGDPEAYSALLGRAEMSQPANLPVRQAIVRHLQARQGNAHVQRLVDNARTEALLQRQVGEEEEEELLQTMQRGVEQEDASKRGDRSGQLASLLRSSGTGHPLDTETQARMSGHLGYDLSAVRIHDDTRAHQASEILNARAFTRGRDIFLGKATPSPRSSQGRALLAHELAHVVQQASGQPIQTVGEIDGFAIGGEQHEREADAVSERVVQGERVPPRQSIETRGAPVAFQSSPVLQLADGGPAPESTSDMDVDEEELMYVPPEEEEAVREEPELITPSAKIPLPESPIVGAPIPAGLIIIVPSLKLSGDLTATRINALPAPTVTANAGSLEAEVSQELRSAFGSLSYEVTSSGLAISFMGQNFPLSIKVSFTGIELTAPVRNVDTTVDKWRFQGSMSMVLTLTFQGNWFAVRALALSLMAIVAAVSLASRIAAWLAPAIRAIGMGLQFVTTRIFIPIILIPGELLREMMRRGPGRRPGRPEIT